MEKDIRDEELAAMQAEGEEEVICVVLTDEQGNEHEFYQDMVITVDDKQFAVLVPMEDCCCEDDDCDFDDEDEMYEVCCPSCGDTILLNDSILEEGSMECPNCGETLEFDYDDLVIEDAEDPEDTDE